MNKNPDKIKGNPFHYPMDSIHQGPHYIPDLTREGRVHSDKILAELNRHPKAAEFQQLCLYNPAKEGHVATGVKRADLSLLQKVSDALYSGENTTIKLGVPAHNAAKILKATGIAPETFTPLQRIHLARLLGEGLVSAEWALAIQDALENGNLTSGIVDNMIGAKIKGQQLVMDIIQKAAGKGINLRAFNAGELQQIASLLLSDNPPIDGTWIEQHATALAQGGITHEAFQDILIHAKNVAEESVRAESKAQAEEKEKAKQIAKYPLTHAAGLHGFKQHAAGFHSSTQSWHAMVAREIAQRVIGKDGKVDDKAIARIREEMGSDIYRQSAPKDPHWTHVLAMLDALESNEGGMRDLVESIGAPKQPLTSKAAHKIRSTLGLAPDTPITQVHARQAALSALFANMRQHAYVGSCFATSVAIRVHDNDPIRSLRDIKSLIEHDYLEVKTPRANVQMPVATSVNVRSLRNEIQVNVVDQGEDAPYAIITTLKGVPINETVEMHEIPGVEAALNAIGIAKENHNGAILEALKSVDKGKTSLEAILEQVIKNQGVEGKAAREKLTLAADAFAAQESNPMLRMWEYTLAGFTGAQISTKNIMALRTGIIGANIPGSSQKLLDGINSVIREELNPKLQRSITLGASMGIGTKVQREFVHLITQRIQARFHASHSDLTETSQSGWEMYYTNSKGESKTIQTDEDFKEFLVDTFRLACESVQKDFGSEHRSLSDQNLAQHFPTDALCSHLETVLSTPGLMEEIVNKANNSRAQKVIYRDPAWFIRSGGFTEDTLQGYYGVSPGRDIPATPIQSMKTLGQSFPKHLVQEIKEGVQKNSMTGIPQNITVSMSGHTLNFTTQADPQMQAILESKTPLIELNQRFYDPGQALYDKNLSEGEIRTILASLFSTTSGQTVNDEFMDSLMPSVMDDLKASNATGKPRELRDTCTRLFNVYFENGMMDEGMLDAFFIQAINPPSIAFIDKNYYEQQTAGNKCVSFLYNPINGKVELWDTLNTGDGFIPISPANNSYQSANWTLFLHPSFYPELPGAQEAEAQKEAK